MDKGNSNIIGIHGTIAAGKNLLAQLLDWSVAGISTPFKEWATPDKPYLEGTYYTIHAFADPVKEDLANLTSTGRLQWEDRAFKSKPLKGDSIPQCFKGVTPRDLMQEYGEGMRKVWLDFWIDRIDLRVDREQPLLFTDVRHQNERDYIKSLGGIVIGIERPQSPSQWLWFLTGEKVSLHWNHELIDVKTFKKYLENPFPQWEEHRPLLDKALKRLTHQSESEEVQCDYWITNKGTIDSILHSFYQLL